MHDNPWRDGIIGLLFGLVVLAALVGAFKVLMAAFASTPEERAQEQREHEERRQRQLTALLVHRYVVLDLDDWNYEEKLQFLLNHGYRIIRTHDDDVTLERTAENFSETQQQEEASDDS